MPTQKTNSRSNIFGLAMTKLALESRKVTEMIDEMEIGISIEQTVRAIVPADVFVAFAIESDATHIGLSSINAGSQARRVYNGVTFIVESSAPLSVDQVDLLSGSEWVVSCEMVGALSVS